MKKKKIIFIVLSIIMLLILIGGATYAYFTIDIKNSVTNTGGEVKTGKPFAVTLKGTDNNNLKISLDTNDMAFNNQKDYYATTSGNYKTTKELINIANLEVLNNILPTNICTVKVKIDLTGNMKDVLKLGDAILHIEGGRSSHNIDLSVLLKEYPLEFEVSDANNFPINTYLKITNSSLDQSYLAGTNLTATINIEDVTCRNKNDNDAIEVLLSNSGTSSLENQEDVSARGDVLRRFQGSNEVVNDNYICFGTYSESECKEHHDKYMYRIIGVVINNDEDTNTQYGQMKLIKKEALKDGIQWSTDYNVNTTWPDSNILKELKGDKYWNSSEEFVPEVWKSKAAMHDWYYGDMLYLYGMEELTGEGMFGVENGKTPSEYYEYLKIAESNEPYCPEGSEYTFIHGTTVSLLTDQYICYIHRTEKWKNKAENEKIGLIKLSDYYLSQGKNVCCVLNNDCLNGWIHISHNDEKHSKWAEWTMSRQGFVVTYGGYSVQHTLPEGGVANWHSQNAYAVRPVIYTVSNLQLSGSGTMETPYMIVEK